MPLHKAKVTRSPCIAARTDAARCLRGAMDPHSWNPADFDWNPELLVRERGHSSAARGASGDAAREARLRTRVG